MLNQISATQETVKRGICKHYFLHSNLKAEYRNKCSSRTRLFGTILTKKIVILLLWCNWINVIAPHSRWRCDCEERERYFVDDTQIKCYLLCTIIIKDSAWTGQLWRMSFGCPSVCLSSGISVRLFICSDCENICNMSLLHALTKLLSMYPAVVFLIGFPS